MEAAKRYATERCFELGPFYVNVTTGDPIELLAQQLDVRESANSSLLDAITTSLMDCQALLVITTWKRR